MDPTRGLAMGNAMTHMEELAAPGGAQVRCTTAAGAAFVVEQCECARSTGRVCDRRHAPFGRSWACHQTR
eukprot:11476373-Alexandrium_andersonii.AAC.1